MTRHQARELAHELQKESGVTAWEGRVSVRTYHVCTTAGIAAVVDAARASGMTDLAINSLGVAKLGTHLFVR